MATEQPESVTVPGDLEVVGFHEFVPTPEDVSAARHFVGQVLREQGASEDMVASAELVVDEFALNAVRHAGSFFSVVVEHGPGMAKVAVRDDSDVFPAVREHVVLSIAGRGLSIVASTAEEWGAESLGHGKEVWAPLREH